MATKNNDLFDTSIRIKLEGPKAKRLRDFLDKKMDRESRTTYSNAIADILFTAAGIKSKK